MLIATGRGHKLFMNGGLYYAQSMKEWSVNT